MMRSFSIATTTMFAFALVACGGGDSGAADSAPAAEMDTPATTPPPAEMSQELTTPDWYSYDAAANKVTLTVTAGLTPVNNAWNFNGGVHGDMDIVVPVGAAIELSFTNKDTLMPHSLGISSTPGTQLPTMFTDATPAFEGALSAGALDMMTATQLDETEVLNFTASEAGEYTMVCFVPAHAVTGMWIKFTVSAEGEAGVRGAA